MLNECNILIDVFLYRVNILYRLLDLSHVACDHGISVRYWINSIKYHDTCPYYAFPCESEDDSNAVRRAVDTIK